MRITRLVSASVAAFAVAVTLGSASASGQSQRPDGTATPKAAAAPVSFDQSAALTGVAAAPKASGESVFTSARFATLAGVTAVPMSARELDTVKGQHIHFFVNGELRLVNPTEQRLVDLGTGVLVGPGYNGICVASSLGSAVTGAAPC